MEKYWRKSTFWDILVKSKVRAYQNNCDFQYRRNFYVHLVEHTPNTEKPTSTFPFLGVGLQRQKFLIFSAKAAKGQKS